MTLQSFKMVLSFRGYIKKFRSAMNTRLFTLKRFKEAIMFQNRIYTGEYIYVNIDTFELFCYLTAFVKNRDILNLDRMKGKAFVNR